MEDSKILNELRKEQSVLKEKIETLSVELSNAKDKIVKVNRLIDLVEKFGNIK